MDWGLYFLAAIGGAVAIIGVTYLITELPDLISGIITHIRRGARAEKELSELRFRIGELEKKVLGSNED